MIQDGTRSYIIETSVQVQLFVMTQISWCSTNSICFGETGKSGL